MSFSDFWTNKNNPALPKSEYLYGPKHILVLLVVLIASVTLSIFFRNKSKRAKHILLYTFAGILLFFEIASRVVNLIIADTYTVASVFEILLPMHICSVMVWVFIVATFTQVKCLKNFAAIGGLIATVAFLAYPAVGLNRTYFSFTCLYSTFSHMLGFVTAILYLTLGEVEFKFKDIWQTYLCFVVMFAWGALVNFVIFPGSDYMYMVNDPLELNLPFPYQILYLAILAIYVAMFYVVPFAYKKIKAKREESKQ